MSDFVDGNQQPLLTPEEAALYLRCSKAKLAKDRLSKKGLPYIKFGAKVLYRRADLESLLSISLVTASAHVA